MNGIVKVKLWMWLWLWWFKTQSQTDVSNNNGITFRTTFWYKEVGDSIYIVKEKYETTATRGKEARRQRRYKGNRSWK